MRSHKHYDLICLVTNDLNNDRRMLRTCASMASWGWRVLMIGRELPSSLSLPEDLSIDLMRVQCSCNTGWGFYLEVIWRFYLVLKDMDYSRILCADIDTLGILHITKHDDREVYFDAHEFFVEVPELQGKSIKKYLWSQWAVRAMSSVDHAYTVCESLATILTKKYNKDFKVIRNVPLRSTQSLRLRQKGAIIKLVYLGVLNPDRGLSLLIEAVLKIDYIHLTIVGDGPVRARLKELAAADDRIKFIGMIVPAEISQYLAEADIGVNLLSAQSLNYYYSLANKFFDYLHAGLPVMCMNYPEYAKIAEQYNCIYPVHKLSLHDIILTLEGLKNTSKEVWELRQTETQRAIIDHNWQAESELLKQLYGCYKHP